MATLAEVKKKVEAHRAWLSEHEDHLMAKLLGCRLVSEEDELAAAGVLVERDALEPLLDEVDYLRATRGMSVAAALERCAEGRHAGGASVRMLAAFGERVRVFGDDEEYALRRAVDVVRRDLARAVSDEYLYRWPDRVEIGEQCR